MAGGNFKKKIEFPLVYGSLTSMQRSCAHFLNPRGHSWPGPSQAPASGPSPFWTWATAVPQRIAENETAAKKRKNTRIFANFALFRGSFRVPAAPREGFISQRHDDSQGRINETAESSQIVPNRAKSRQIDVWNIVLQIRLKIEPLASPARAKPPLSEARIVTRPGVQMMICALNATAGS